MCPERVVEPTHTSGKKNILQIQVKYQEMRVLYKHESKISGCGRRHLVLVTQSVQQLSAAGAAICRLHVVLQWKNFYAFAPRSHDGPQRTDMQKKDPQTPIRTTSRQVVQSLCDHFLLFCSAFVSLCRCFGSRCGIVFVFVFNLWGRLASLFRSICLFVDIFVSLWCFGSLCSWFLSLWGLILELSVSLYLFCLVVSFCSCLIDFTTRSDHFKQNLWTPLALNPAPARPLEESACVCTWWAHCSFQTFGFFLILLDFLGLCGTISCC